MTQDEALAILKTGLNVFLTGEPGSGKTHTINRWYANEHILDGTPTASHKVALADAVRITLKKGLWLLGIEAPERM